MQMMAAFLVVALVVFPCTSDAIKCHVTNMRNDQGCWEWVLDDPNNSNCDVVVTGGLSLGVICCSQNFHKSRMPHLFDQSAEDNSDNNNLPTSSETSPATKPTNNETSTSDSSSTTDADNVTARPGTTGTTRHSNDETSESGTTDGDSVSLAPPTPAYSEVCSRSYLSRTPNLSYWFRYMEIPPSLFQPKLTVEFEVKASQDVHVALAPSRQSSDDFYQVVIGGSGNSAAFIKRAMSATRLVNVNMYKPLNETVFRGFWITYNVTSGHIAVGKHNKEDHFISWTDPSPLNVSYVGFSTNENSEGQWRFCDFERNHCSVS